MLAVGVAGINPAWCVRTGRLQLRPVWGGDLDDLVALKSDPQVFGLLLGGVRSRRQATDDLAADVAFWGAHGVGMWMVRHAADNGLIGLAGIMQRSDGRGMSLRFALRPGCRGRGYASEMAFAALRFAHERGRLRRVVGVARATNIASREVLGAIGMSEAETFHQHGHPMLLFESIDSQAAQHGPK